MKRFYSQSTGCTYIIGVHSVMPPDAVEINGERYDAVIANPELGKIRVHDETGLPYLIDPPVLLPDPAVAEREWRDAKLSSVIWLRERHRDQLEVNAVPTLTTEQFAELLAYMQTLRDWPQSPGFPDSEKRPSEPSWLSSQVV